MINSHGEITPTLMALLLNVLKVVHGFAFKFTMGMVVMLNPENADYLEYESMKENSLL